MHTRPRPRRGAAIRPALAGTLVAALTMAAAAPGALAATPQVVDTTAQTAPPAAFDRLASQAEAEPDGRTRVIVTLKARFDRTETSTRASASKAERQMRQVRERALEALTGTVHSDFSAFDGLPYVALDASEEAIRALEESGLAASIQRDRVLKPQLPDTTQIIESVPQVARGWDGSGGTIAIVDSGIDTDHPFFAGRIVSQACFSKNSSCPNGGTVQFGPGAAEDPENVSKEGHGTRVSGVAAGQRFAGIEFDGVGPGANIMPIRINGAWGALQSDAMQALAYVRDQVVAGTADVVAVNMSQGNSLYGDGIDTCDSDPLKAYIDQLVELGIPTIIASGNEGQTDTILYPACITSAITVGATRKDDTVADFSNATDRIDLLAPGAGTSSNQQILTSFLDGGFWGGAGSAGTSLAAPHVAGAWAAYLERYPGSSVSEVRAAFYDSGKMITDTRNGTNLVRPRINVSAAMARHGYVVANSSSSSSYTPGNQANSEGATNTVARTGTGIYTVSMPKLGSALYGNVHVETYFGSANRCKVASRGANGSTTLIGVQCTTPAGAPANTTFLARFEVNETKRTASAGYLTSLQPTAAAHTPALSLQANSTGATNTVTRTGVGSYLAKLPGLTGTVTPHVTAVGTDTNVCQVSTWLTTSFSVKCFTRTGAPADTAFSLTVNGQSVFTPGAGAQLYANNATATTAYTPSGSWNSTGAVNTSRKTATGTYEVSMPGIGMTGSVPTVTAVNNTSVAVACRPYFWGTGSVDVRCTNAAGTPVDARFTVSYSSVTP